MRWQWKQNEGMNTFSVKIDSDLMTRGKSHQSMKANVFSANTIDTFLCCKCVQTWASSTDGEENLIEYRVYDFEMKSTRSSGQINLPNYWMNSSRLIVVGGLNRLTTNNLVPELAKCRAIERVVSSSIKWLIGLRSKRTFEEYCSVRKESHCVLPLKL